MPVNTQPNISLVLTLDGTAVECQVITLDFQAPGVGTSTVTQTACPDGIVSEPGSISAGSITGEAFSDSADSGITWLLAQANEDDSPITYSLTFWPELGATKAMKWDGVARVNTFRQPFAKPGVGRQPIDLEVTSATLTRPTASAA